MTQRTRIFSAVVDALGPLVVGEVLPRDAWPGFFWLNTAVGSIPIAAHVSTVSSHARKAHEQRFQNPGNLNRPPVSDLNNSALPILLGVDSPLNPEIFVAVDGRSRLGNTARFSILFDTRILREAREYGWAVYEPNRGERIYAFVPSLLPIYVEQILSGEALAPEQISAVVVTSGMLDSPQDQETTALAAERATRAVQILVRRARAGRNIRAAYDNKCCMCGIGASFLAGAHIFPVEAPGSNDEIWNGLSLCHNHHSAFDSHQLWIHPTNGSICIHPNLWDEARFNIGTQRFIESTFRHLALPNRAAHNPRPAMFRQRYDYFSGKYSWATTI